MTPEGGVIPRGDGRQTARIGASPLGVDDFQPSAAAPGHSQDVGEAFRQSPHKVLRTLREEGLTHTEPGLGSFVAERPGGSGADPA